MNPHSRSPQQKQQVEQAMTMLRENIRTALNEYKAALKVRLTETPRGSGHAVNEFDHLQASITQVESAKRVLYMED